MTPRLAILACLLALCGCAGVRPVVQASNDTGAACYLLGVRWGAADMDAPVDMAQTGRGARAPAGCGDSCSTPRRPPR